MNDGGSIPSGERQSTRDTKYLGTKAEPLIATYSVRSNAFVVERHYIVTSNELLWIDGNQEDVNDVSGRLLLADITELKLRYSPSRLQHGRCTAQIVMRKGGSMIIPSGHYSGFAEFEDRTTAYEPFARALAAAIRYGNKSAKFLRGYDRSSLLLGAMLGTTFLAFMIMLMPAVLAVGAAAIIPLLLIIVGGGPAAIAEIRRNWPGSFDPLNIPDDLLPGTSVPPYIDPGLARIVRALMR
jgi:hypothetical protein